MKYLLALFLLVVSASAAQAAMNHPLSTGGKTPGPAALEYMKAMDDMHGPMMRGVMDPDPDTAFVRGMLWHHRGAVDMARIQLRYGRDPELKKLAEAILKAQQPEIDYMQGWLKLRNLPE